MSEVQTMSHRRFTSPEVQRLLQKSEGRCWYCGIGLSPENCHIDHVRPVIAGGDDSPTNLVAACRTCNLVKGRKPLELFRETKARLAAGAPKFTDDQIAYLAEHGIELPAIPYYEFWFEVMRDE